MCPRVTGQRLPRLFDTIDVVLENQTLRVATGVLNEILTEAVAMQQPPSDKGRRLKIFYMTQVAVKPPAFVVFVNEKKLMHFSYLRYLENKIREAFGFRGTALEVHRAGEKRERGVEAPVPAPLRKEEQKEMERIICLLIGYAFGADPDVLYLRESLRD